MSITIDNASLQCAEWLYRICGSSGLQKILLDKNPSFWDENYSLDVVNARVFDLSAIYDSDIETVCPNLVERLNNPIELYYSIDAIEELNCFELHRFLHAWISIVYGPERLSEAVNHMEQLCLTHYRRGLLKQSVFWWPKDSSKIKADLARNSDFISYMQSLLDSELGIFPAINNAYFRALLETNIVLDFTSLFENRDFILALTNINDTSLYIPPELDVHKDIIHTLYGYRHTLKEMYHLSVYGSLPPNTSSVIEECSIHC